MKINNIDIPDSMSERGGYVFNPPETLGYTGEGEPITPRGATLEWTFDELDDDEWDWWTQDILGGAKKADFTHAQLYDDDRNLTTFANCRVYRPKREKFLRGKHQNVLVRIVHLWT